LLVEVASDVWRVTCDEFELLAAGWASRPYRVVFSGAAWALIDLPFGVG